MILCDACKRHLKGDDLLGGHSCVFCGAHTMSAVPAPSRLPLRFGVVVLGALAVATASACGPKPMMSMYGAPPIDMPDAGAEPDDAGPPTPIVGKS